MMTALPAISQTRYTTKTDTLTCYTNEENRTIAIIMLEGERDRALLENCDSMVQVYDDQIKTLKEKDERNSKMLGEVYVNYNACYFDNNELTVSNKKLKRNIGISIGLNVLLSLILIL